MLLTKTVKVKWSRRTISHYKNLGYIFTNLEDEFEVKVEELPKGSHSIVECLCDYCLEDSFQTIVPKPYKRYLLENITYPKDACKKCNNKKLKDVLIRDYGVENSRHIPGTEEKRLKTNNERYGCDNPFQNEEVKEKIKQTNLEKYGVENFTQTDAYIEKSISTNLKKYGTEWFSQTDEYLEKRKETNNKKYGYDNYSQTEEYRDRVKNTSIERYGTPFPNQSAKVKDKTLKTHISRYGMWFTKTDEYKNKSEATNMERYGYTNHMKDSTRAKQVLTKVLKGMSEKGSVNTSIQQRYLNNLLNGKINYLIDRCFLDIAFPDEHIYLEYQGSGHDIDVKYGKLTESQFKNKEIKRYYFLKSQGWKEIEIISLNDYLPEDDIIIKLIDAAKQKLNENCNWVKIDIDNNLFITKYNKIDYNLGKLHKIN